jgi:YgiT-type zinc finger domain-containing protein
MKDLECFECDQGYYREYLLPYKTTDAENKEMTVLDIPHLVCNNCGETLLSAKSSRMIEEARIAVGVTYRERKRLW